MNYIMKYKTIHLKILGIKSSGFRNRQNSFDTKNMIHLGNTGQLDFFKIKRFLCKRNKKAGCVDTAVIQKRLLNSTVATEV